MQDDTFELFIDWRKKDNDLKIIMKLRRILPGFGKQAIDKIRDLIKEGQSYRLGRYYAKHSWGTATQFGSIWVKDKMRQMR